MDSARWQRLETLFHDALELPPDQRAAYLREVEPDETLRADVLRLLDADADPATLDPGAAERLASLVAEPLASSASATPSLEGRQIGPYRVVRRIGEGGMGAVYLAERSDVDRRVALKLVRGALAAPELVRRFLRERRVLARLDHPNIARLLDAGVTEDETPYFAMEYVEGEAITDHCRRVNASMEAVLRLFRDVCSAVSYAHGSLVVHRDIKPSNVLVTEDGSVKLLDFGIAKLLGDEDDDATLTRTGVRVMSPAYAAPEQVRGEPVTTATDVYALGVLLRELLTGDREPGAGRSLSGDLEAICLRAAAPEPERRYRSADQLSADIGRHLEGLPLEARLPTLRYRAGKFLRRHAAGVAVTVAIVVSLGGGLGVALWQAQRADRAREQAETALERSETVTSFLTDLFDAARPSEARGEDVTARELLDRGVQRVDELGDDPLLQARILRTLATVNMDLGSYPQADSLLARSVAIRRGLPADSELVSDLNIRGRALYFMGLPDSAVVVWTEALELGEALLGEEHSTTLGALNNLAVALGRIGRHAESEAALRRLIQIERRALDPDHPDRAYAMNNLGIELTNRGAYDEAEPLFREVVRIRLAAADSGHPAYAQALDNLGMMLREAGRYDEAEPILRQGLAIRRRVLGEEHRFYGESLFSLGTLLALRAGPGDLAEADTLLNQGLRVYRAALGADNPATAYILHSLGIVAEQRGDLVGAEQRYRQALAIRLGSGRDAPMVAIQTLTALAGVLRRQEVVGDAVARAREGVALAEEHLPADHPVRGAVEAELGIALAAAGDADTGAERFRTGIGIVFARIGADHPGTRRLCDHAASVGIPDAAALEGCAS